MLNRFDFKLIAHQEKAYFKHKSDLMLASMTCKVKLHIDKNLRFYNVVMHRKFQ